MSAPTAPELEALKQFRSRVTDLRLEKETDLSMLRWLRARELNLDQAEEMLRKHIQWRKDEKLDEILDWVPPEIIKENYQFEITGHDDKGRPICIIPFGDWDMRKAVKSGTRELFLRNVDLLFAQVYAKMKENSVKFKWEITQCIVIADFANFGMSQLTCMAGVNTLLETARRFESNYPESLYAVYYVNSFRVFQMLFSMMKPFLSARTLSKLQIYTTPDKWMPVLQNDLPHDQFPPEFGGRRPGRRISVGNALRIDMVDLDDSEITSDEILAVQQGAKGE